MDSTPEELLAVAEEAARAAADELVGRFGHGQRQVRSKSTPTDLVSEADVAAEAAIRAVLGARRPDDAILGEEGGETAGSGSLRWVIDPLDGTTNFLFGIPQWAVSVACEDGDGAIAGVVAHPVAGETFAAYRGGPATLNGDPVTAAAPRELATSLVATGFAYEATIRARQADTLTRVLPRVRDIRRAGAAALDLAWLACGRHDLYYERGVQPWDIAAGGLIASCAGLTVQSLPATDELPVGVIAGPAGLVAELRGLVLGA